MDPSGRWQICVGGNIGVRCKCRREGGWVGESGIGQCNEEGGGCC